MRIRLLIDVETEDIPRLQNYIGESPIVQVLFLDSQSEQATWILHGRLEGAQEAHRS